MYQSNCQARAAHWETSCFGRHNPVSSGYSQTADGDSFFHCLPNQTSVDVHLRVFSPGRVHHIAMSIWKRKLAAYLHDPPSKALDIRDHEEHAKTLFRQAGFDAEEADDYAKHFAQPSDWTASAADRLPFPKSVAAGVSCQFDGHRNQFHHALGPGDLGQSAALFQFHAPFTSVELARETDQGVQPVLTDASLAGFSEADRWKARFFAHWRLWPRNCVEKDYRFSFLPADTRLPDHTVWTHMQVVSALDACADRPGKDAVLTPAFLKFQLGPVQDFIAAARSIRDLWSGSYLLSWLMAAGLKALSAEVGPDAVIFPNLRGQPLFDLHWRDDLWSKVNIGTQTVWESLGHEGDEENPRKTNHSRLLTPNLPNVFLAVVPADRAADLGRKVAEAIAAEWEKIAAAVWTECEKAGLTADEGDFSSEARKARFNAQISRFLSLSWQATPWPNELKEALKLAEGFDKEMPIQKACQHVQAVVDMATKQMPVDHRDRRYYTDASKTELKNIGLGWSVILGFNSWQLDAVRQTRSFAAANTGGWQTGTFNNKDVLTGRDEAVAGGTAWADKTETMGGAWKSLFKHGDWLSAPTLVKRVWHLAYLGKAPWNLETTSRSFPMPNTRGIAAHDPFAKDTQFNDEENSEDVEKQADDKKYFAVLAFDGDEIGKWVSGEKTPPFRSQLADYHDHDRKVRQGALEYFERESDPDGKGTLKDRFADLRKARRPLSPSYHLQFSEALSNFALLCARPIVEAFDGRLIYAGGDDVVALLPADTALACAEALRAAFTGREVKAPNGNVLFSSPAPGFLTTENWQDQQQRPIPFLVPGPAADASIGIAIAHFKAPLQDVVRAAHDAEKRAKKQLGRSAVAVTLFKRSGETIEWGCNWAGGGLQLYRALADALDAGQLSGKFPYRFAELLSPYITESTPLVTASGTAQPVTAFRADEVIQQEFKHTLGRQRGPAFPSEKESREQLLASLTTALDGYLGNLANKSTEEQLRAVIGLCQTVAFAHRTRSEIESWAERQTA